MTFVQSNRVGHRASRERRAIYSSGKSGSAGIRLASPRRANNLILGCEAQVAAKSVDDFVAKLESWNWRDRLHYQWLRLTIIHLRYLDWSHWIGPYGFSTKGLFGDIDVIGYRVFGLYFYRTARIGRIQDLEDHHQTYNITSWRDWLVVLPW